MSIYYHDKHTILELEIRKLFVYEELRKFIISYDMAAKFNDLLNVSQDRKTNQWPLEKELLDLTPLLNAGGVSRPDHLAQFLDIAFAQAKNKETVNNRARKINKHWHKLALELRKDLED